MGPTWRSGGRPKDVAPERFAALLEEARAGSESAWAEIYRDLAPAVHGYLRTSGAPDPEDTLSEVFLQIARDVPGFEGDERQFRSWVFTIAHHRLIDDRRAAGRRPPEVDTPAEDHAEIRDVEDR